MPVTTRSYSEKDDKPTDPNKNDAIDMAAAKTKPLTLKYVMDSIKSLKTKFESKLEDQVKILTENQDNAQYFLRFKAGGLR